MIKVVINRCMMGIAFGGIWTFVVLTIMHFNGVDATVSQIWINMLCSFIIGIYFGLSSIIFLGNDWSILKQTVIHFLISKTIYFIIALSVGWVEVSFRSIFFTAIIFIGIYIIFFYGYYRHYKLIEESMNATIEKKETE